MIAQHKDSNPPPDRDAEASARKRVCKACDRCRLKKSKCDGSSPCNRCQADNTICVFGERRKAQDKVYPKGYVEMLEQQQEKLVNALRDMYDRMERNEGWPGLPLQKSDKGHPLTHDILERLGWLKLSPDEYEEPFEENPADLLRRATFKQNQSPYARIKQEDNPYPTPATLQSDFSPADSETGDLLPSMCRDPFQFTPPSGTPEQHPLGISPPFGPGIPMNYGWQRPMASYPATPGLYGFDSSQSYNGLGIFPAEDNPCLPTYNEDFKYLG